MMPQPVKHLTSVELADLTWSFGLQVILGSTAATITTQSGNTFIAEGTKHGWSVPTALIVACKLQPRRRLVKIKESA